MSSKKLSIELSMDDLREAVRDWVIKNEGEAEVEVGLTSNKLGEVQCTVQCLPHETKVTKKRKIEEQLTREAEEALGFVFPTEEVVNG